MNLQRRVRVAGCSQSALAEKAEVGIDIMGRNQHDSSKHAVFSRNGELRTVARQRDEVMFCRIIRAVGTFEIEKVCVERD